MRWKWRLTLISCIEKKVRKIENRSRRWRWNRRRQRYPRHAPPANPNPYWAARAANLPVSAAWLANVKTLHFQPNIFRTQNGLRAGGAHAACLLRGTFADCGGARFNCVLVLRKRRRFSLSLLYLRRVLRRGAMSTRQRKCSSLRASPDSKIMSRFSLFFCVHITHTLCCEIDRRWCFHAIYITCFLRSSSSLHREESVFFARALRAHHAVSERQVIHNI